MVGSVIDQKVFLHLVQTHLPVLSRHLLQVVEIDLQLVSVPWFVCLYLSSLPLSAAGRVLDCFFYQGPRFLFQLGLAVLKFNEEALLQATDDDEVLQILKTGFSQISDGDLSANLNGGGVNPPEAGEEEKEAAESEQKESRNGKEDRRILTEVLTMAVFEFGFLTTVMIEELRTKFRLV